MEIPQLKQLLPLADLLQHLGLKPNNRKALRCPFHQSNSKRIQYTMQYYPETNTAYCFSTNCPTHGHSLDIISFAKNFFKLATDHEAIMKCKQIIHELGRWPQDLFNPFINQEETLSVNLPMKTIEETIEEDINQGEVKLIIEKSANNPPEQQEPTPINKHHPHPPLPQLTRNSYGQLCFFHQAIQIHLLQEPDIKNLNSLRVGLLIQKNPHQYAKEAIRQGSIDLYHYEGLQKFIKHTAEKLQTGLTYTTEVFAIFIELLEKYKMEKYLQAENKKQQSKEQADIIQALTETQAKKMWEILRSKNPLTGINELIGKSGIVGEENNRLFIYTLLNAYKLQQPLGVLIQGSSGSGKTSLFWGILIFFPKKDVIARTRFTEGAFYNFEEYEICFTIIGVEDMDGLGPNALYGLREISSNGFISSSVTQKNPETEKMQTIAKNVNGPIGFIGCTTKAELYEDNMGRVFTVAVDESEEQTKRIVEYQNKLHAGKINKQEQEEAKLILQHIVRNLQPVEVINPSAEKINLPDETHQQRRLNRLFKIYIDQVTRMFQYSIKPNKDGVYITTKKIIQLAADSFFECIVLKCDELNGELRKFYEWLKEYIKQQAKKNGHHEKEYKFTQREIRHAYNKSKSQISKYFDYLKELEYLQVHGKGNHHVTYSIDYWDDHKALRSRLKKFIQDQIDALPDDE